MKLKSYIFQIALAAVGAGFLGSCEDMLEPTSDYVIYENGSHLTTPADTATSLTVLSISCRLSVTVPTCWARCGATSLL